MPKIAANISMLFREVATLDRFQAARAAGFDGVEMQFPYAESPNELARAAQAAGMPIVLINAPVSRQYPFGLAGRPEMRDSFRSQLTQISEYAEALDVRFVHVLAGPSYSIDERESCCRTYAENLLLAADALAPRGVGVPDGVRACLAQRVERRARDPRVRRARAASCPRRPGSSR